MSVSENVATDTMKASTSSKIIPSNGPKASISAKSITQTSPEHDVFLFECDHLINFCEQFDQSDITDQTDSVLQVKLNDLEQRWLNLQNAYKNVMLSPKSANVKDF